MSGCTIVSMSAENPTPKDQKHRIRAVAEDAKRLAPRIREYGGLCVEGADGVTRPVLPEVVSQYGGRLAALGMEYKDPMVPEHGFRMSQTDGVPVPVEHDFLDAEPPFGDPL